MSVSVIRKLKNEGVVWGARVVLAGALLGLVAFAVHSDGGAPWRESLWTAVRVLGTALWTAAAIIGGVVAIGVLLFAAGGVFRR